MTKKILLLLLVCLLGYGVFSSWAHGVKINFLNQSINTHSYAWLIEKANELAAHKQALETKNTTEFSQALTKQNAAISVYNQKKNDYESLASQSSVDEIRKANQKEAYYLDYLWMKIGTYANDSDVKVLITPNPENSTVVFDITGQYIAVINFIYDLENDSELLFNIDNLVMQGGYSSSTTKANFIVGNVNIVKSETEANSID